MGRGMSASSLGGRADHRARGPRGRDASDARAPLHRGDGRGHPPTDGGPAGAPGLREGRRRRREGRCEGRGERERAARVPGAERRDAGRGDPAGGEGRRGGRVQGRRGDLQDHRGLRGAVWGRVVSGGAGARARRDDARAMGPPRRGPRARRPGGRALAALPAAHGQGLHQALQVRPDAVVRRGLHPLARRAALRGLAARPEPLRGARLRAGRARAALARLRARSLGRRAAPGEGALAAGGVRPRPGDERARHQLELARVENGVVTRPRSPPTPRRCAPSPCSSEPSRSGASRWSPPR